MIGIYCIKNSLTGWNYIGSSISIPNRWKQHIKELEENKHHCHRLQKAWDTDGNINFSFSILEICGEEELIQREQHWIDTLYNNGEIYNTKVKIQEDKKIVSNTNKASRKQKKTSNSDNVFFVKGISVNRMSIGTGRIFAYIMKLTRESKSSYVEFSIGTYIKYMDIRSNSIYEHCESIYKPELEDVTIDGKPMFDEIEYNGGIFILNLNKYALSKISANEVINTDISIKQLKYATGYSFMKFLVRITGNNNKLKMTVADMKLIFCDKDQYCQYANLKIKMIKRMQEDFTNINKELIANEYKKGRAVESVEFILK